MVHSGHSSTRILRIVSIMLPVFLLVLPLQAQQPDTPVERIRLDIPGPPAAADGSALPALMVTYTSRQQGYHEVSLTLSGGGNSKNLSMIPRFGTHTLYLYPALIGFWPETLDIGTLPGMEITTLSVVGHEKADAPIPADAGTMIEYGPEHWRKEAYELFSWNLAPDILVYVTKDYQEQARMFKRLAFFVEKPGFSGKLHSNETIGNRHGWNAHDYRAEDLARFFRKAREENFTLNPEEEILFRELTANGILRREDGIIMPGSGSVLSVSMETPLALRTKFLIHESFHGLFFTSPRFRIACLDSWRNLSRAEQDFWKMFFSYRTYNINNEFLLVNEFMAYLMQQEKSDLDWYYKEFVANQLTGAYPERKQEIEKFYRDYPDTFLLSATRIEKAAEALFGVRAGDLACIMYNP